MKYKYIIYKVYLLLLAVCYCTLSYGQKKDYPIQNVLFTQVKLTDNFWLPRIEVNRTVTIPASFSRCESTGRVKNFVMATEKKGKFCTKFPFDDNQTLTAISYYSWANRGKGEMQI